MYIRDVATAFPEKIVTSEEIVEWNGQKIDFITSKIGVKQRHFLSETETTTSLAKIACDNLFSKSPELSREDVEFLILVTQNNDYTLPHGSAILQDTLGLGTQTACFDVNLGCSGYVYALSIAKGFAIANGLNNGIVVTCDPYSKVMSKTDTNVLSLFGDAATATWVSNKGGAKILNTDFGTLGANFRDLIIENGGTQNTAAGIFPSEELSEEGWNLKMNGRGIFNFMMEKVPETIDVCLKKNSLLKEDIDLFLFHQASHFMLSTLINGLSLPTEKAPINVERVGNTVSSSIPILLEENLFSSNEKPSRHILLCGFGVGLSWATTVLEV